MVFQDSPSNQHSLSVTMSAQSITPSTVDSACGNRHATGRGHQRGHTSNGGNHHERSRSRSPPSERRESPNYGPAVRTYDSDYDSGFPHCQSSQSRPWLGFFGGDNSPRYSGPCPVSQSQHILQSIEDDNDEISTLPGDENKAPSSALSRRSPWVDEFRRTRRRQYYSSVPAGDHSSGCVGDCMDDYSAGTHGYGYPDDYNDHHNPNYNRDNCNSHNIVYDDDHAARARDDQARDFFRRRCYLAEDIKWLREELTFVLEELDQPPLPAPQVDPREYQVRLDNYHEARWRRDWMVELVWEIRGRVRDIVSPPRRWPQGAGYCHSRSRREYSEERRY
jgi:hypothetical protein